MKFFDYLDNDLRAWARKPYDLDADLFNWFLTIGALVCATYLWTAVVKRVVNVV